MFHGRLACPWLLRPPDQPLHNGSSLVTLSRPGDASYNAINLQLPRGTINTSNVGILPTTVGVKNVKMLRKTVGKISLHRLYRGTARNAQWQILGIYLW